MNSYSSMEDMNYRQTMDFSPYMAIQEPIIPPRQQMLRPQQYYPSNRIIQERFRPPYPASYQPSPLRMPASQEGSFIPMNGTNPIRGMITSQYPDTCSQYGSSSIQGTSYDYYGGSSWCQVGILMNNQHHPNSMYGLEARFKGNTWEFRARDALVGLYIYMDTIGNGSYGAYRTNDTIFLPGKEGRWTIQIQTEQQPYLLYVPV